MVTVRIKNVRHGQGCPGWCFGASTSCLWRIILARFTPTYNLNVQCALVLDIKLQEPPCFDGPHPNAETVSWLVIESGSWSMEGCIGCASDESHMLQAGVVEIEGDMRLTGQLFHEVEFYGSGFPVPTWTYRDQKVSPWNKNDGPPPTSLKELTGLPIVVTQVNSYFGSNWVKTRQQQGDNLHFLVGLEEAGSFVNAMNAHTNFEKVGWMAAEMGQFDGLYFTLYTNDTPADHCCLARLQALVISGCETTWQVRNKQPRAIRRHNGA